MTDIVDRLRALNADFLHEEAAAEIERLRAALLKAEMEAEIADIEDVGRIVAVGRREGLKRIVEMFDRRYPYDDIEAEARALLEGER